MRILYFSLPFAAFAIPAAAQDIVVTGAGLDKQSGASAYDTIVVDRDRLALSASGRLEDILRDAAGFQQFRRSDARSAHPTSQGATLRGLGGNASSRALVLLDGVPIADPFGGWVNWSALDPARLDHIRVTRGGGSGSSGPGALAGTIELESIGASSNTTMEGEALYGSRDAVDGTAMLAAPLGNGHAMISAHYAEGDGFIPITAAQRGTADQPAPYQQASFAGRAILPTGDNTELQASGLIFTDQRTRGTDNSDNRNLGADVSLRMVGRGPWAWEAATWVQIREFSSQFASVNAARSAASLTLDQYNVPATGLGGRFELRPPVGDRVQLALGGDVRQSTGQTKEHYLFTAGVPANGREAGGRTRTAGAFADLSLTPTDALTITGGARIDRWWIENGFLHQHSLATGNALPGSAEFPDRSGWEPTGRIGIAFKPTGAITMRAAGYLGWRLPTLNELYRPFRVGNDTTNANPALKPERLKGVDGGLDFRPLPALTLRATVFYNELDDAIGNVTTAQTPTSATRVRDNLDRIRSQGAELEGSLAVGNLSFGLGYAYVDARVRSSGRAGALDGLRPAQTPRHQLSAHAAWHDGERSAGLALRYVAKQFEDDQNSRDLSDALTLDASVAWPLGGGFGLVARAENLTDARVEAGISATGIVERATPRTLWAGISYKLR
jgi:outer membrane receptor protein involved in Fe transport